MLVLLRKVPFWMVVVASSGKCDDKTTSAPKLEFGFGMKLGDELGNKYQLSLSAGFQL